MLTRAFDAILIGAMVTGTRKSTTFIDISSNEINDCYLNCKNIVGEVCNTPIYMLNSTGNPAYNTLFYFSKDDAIHEGAAALVVGSGSTSPTYEDYKLENKLNPTIISSEYTFDNVTWDENDKAFINTVSIIMQNPNAESMTINEMGVQVKWDCLKLNDTNLIVSTSTFLIAREVLDAPVTVPAGGLFTAKFTWKTGRANQPVATGASVTV